MLFFGIDEDLEQLKKQQKSKKEELFGETCLKERVAQTKYRKHVFAEDCNCFSSFLTSLSFDTTIINNVKKMGYEQPTKIQEQAIPKLLLGHNVVASAPTGTGKTAAYGLALVEGALRIRKDSSPPHHNYIKALIITPVEVNCLQINRELERIANNTGVLVSAATRNVGIENKQIDILIATPKQLKLYKNNLTEISWIVVDECDQVFEKSSRSTYQNQVSQVLKDCLSSRLSHSFFSATYDGKLEAWAKSYFDCAVNLNVGVKNVANAFVKQELKFTGSEFGKFLEIKRLLRDDLIELPTLIYVQSKARAIDLAEELKSDVKCKISHAYSGQDKSEQQKCIEMFRDGLSDILIATKVVSRGVDFDKLKTVINFDIPTTIKDYVHKVGRASRGGRLGGQAITFFTSSDKPYLKTIANQIEQSGGTVPDFIKNLKQSKRVQKSKSHINPKRKPFALPDTVK